VSVRIRIVKTALETQCRLPGGKRISAALVDAWANLETLGPETLALIDTGVVEITALAAVSAHARPSDMDLQRIHAKADELVGYCSTVQLPGLDTALIRLCQLADAVLHSTYWNNDTFGPALAIIGLARHRSVDLRDLEQLLDGVDQCTSKYQAHRLPSPTALGVMEQTLN
jgi:hypothetical protein